MTTTPGSQAGRSRGFELRQLPDAVQARARTRVVLFCALLLTAWILDQLMSLGLYFVRGVEASLAYTAAGDLSSIGLCLALLLVALFPRVSALRVLQLSLAFVVCVSFTLSLFETLNLFNLFGRYPTMTWVSLIIAVFPLVIPLPPRAVRWSALLAASMPALALALLVAMELLPRPPAHAYFIVSLHPLVAAGVASIGARALRETTVDVAALEQQRHLMRSVLDSAQAAFFLIGPEGELVYANEPAACLLGRPLTGGAPELDDAPPTLIDAFGEDVDVLFQHQGETWHLSSEQRKVQFAPHRLIVARALTQPLRAQEIEAWRKLVRVLSHELNNTLAPLRSALHLIRRIFTMPSQHHRLPVVLGAIEDRVDHLSGFLEGYAALSRLPAPRKAPVRWSELLEGLAALVPHTQLGACPAGVAHIDAGQIEQVLINLLRNAADAGSSPEDTTLELREREEAGARGVELRICDRGHGMSEEALHNAFVPFYSTRAQGTGLGLPLAREIIEAHGGHVAIAAREGEGLCVSCWLPA